MLQVRDNMGVAPARRQLLVVAFHYPPDNTSSGVLRTLKFTQYLRQHGWQSTVLSVPVALYRNTDRALADMIPPDVSVHRTWAMDIKHSLGVRGVYPGFLTYPDRYWPWLFSAVRRGKALLRDGQFRAIYSTYPVPTAHLIGMRLKAHSGLPWIADFRDPWLEDSMPALESRLATIIERKVVTTADRVICNTPSMRRMFLERYPTVDLAKFVTVTNGYDEPDFSGLVPRTHPKFHIMYPGVIDSGSRNPATLFAGVAVALSRGWLRRDDLAITFLGCGPHGGRPEFRSDVARYGLTEFVQVQEGRIPYRQALEQLAGGDLLVALCEPLGQGQGVEAVKRWTALQVPVKVYEYLRLGRPMVALVSGGAIAEVLDRTGGGCVVAPNDVEGIARALKAFYESRSASQRRTSAISPLVSQYSRENLTRVLADELNVLAPARA